MLSAQSLPYEREARAMHFRREEEVAMKAHQVGLVKCKLTKRKEVVVYKDLEIAMERRALEIHPKIKNETKKDELSNWTEAEADILES